MPVSPFTGSEIFRLAQVSPAHWRLARAIAAVFYHIQGGILWKYVRAIGGERRFRVEEAARQGIPFVITPPQRIAFERKQKKEAHARHRAQRPGDVRHSTVAALSLELPRRP